MAIILAVLMVAAGFGAAEKENLLRISADTTYRDTIEFEYQAALTSEKHSREKAARFGALLERESASQRKR